MLGVVPFIVLGVTLLLVVNSFGTLFQNSVKQLPEVSIEKVEFTDGKIVATVRNTGPSVIFIAQADVNDRIHPAAIEPGHMLSRLAEGRVLIPFNWNVGEPYEIGITLDDGTRFSKSVKAAAPAPHPTLAQASVFALIGTYVGIIPVMMGLLWYPFIRRLSLNKYNFFLSLTIGLLVFLGIDAMLESNEIAVGSLAAIFNAQILIITVVVVSLLSLMYISNKLVQRIARRSDTDLRHDSEKMNYSGSGTDLGKNVSSSISSSSLSSSQQKLLVSPVAISMMIAIGIGLHNFGEGLAIGAATLLGQVGLSSFLILGFTLHNATEGLAIVAPMAKSGKITILKLVFMGVIAGAPTIIGAWIGGFLYSPILTIIFLSVGAGAIFQVVYQVGSWMCSTNGGKGVLSKGSIIVGFAAGMLIMYITGLLV